MELDNSTLELMRVTERRFGMPSYTLIPKLIREEISQIVMIPQYVHNDSGELLEVKFELAIDWNDKNAVTNK